MTDRPLVISAPEPRTLELTGDAIHKASHAYGVNGVITEVEMPLAPAYDWVDVIAAFDDWEATNRFAETMGHAILSTTCRMTWCSRAAFMW